MSDTINQRFVSFAKPFIEASKNIFETMVYTKINPSSPVIKKDRASKGDFSAILGITGTVKKEGDEEESRYQGMVVVSFPNDTYLKVSSAMLMEEHTEYSDEIRDVGGEIVNMIMGNAKRDLAVMGYTTNMAVPTLVNGPGHMLQYPEGTTVVLIPIESAHGEFYIELAYLD